MWHVLFPLPAKWPISFSAASYSVDAFIWSDDLFFFKSVFFLSCFFFSNLWVSLPELLSHPGFFGDWSITKLQWRAGVKYDKAFQLQGSCDVQAKIKRKLVCLLEMYCQGLDREKNGWKSMRPRDYTNCGDDVERITHDALLCTQRLHVWANTWRFVSEIKTSGCLWPTWSEQENNGPNDNRASNLHCRDSCCRSNVLTSSICCRARYVLTHVSLSGVQSALSVPRTSRALTNLAKRMELSASMST